MIQMRKTITAAALAALALFAGCANASAVSLEEAKAIAYAHAGVSGADVYDRSSKRDDGVFEIDFEYGGWDYDYDIALDGTILRWEREPSD